MTFGEKKKRNIVFLASITASGVYLFWRIFFTLPWQEGPASAAGGVALVLAEAVTTFGTMELMISRMRADVRELPFPENIRPEAYPDVDVLIATHNEPPELLYKTVNACTFLEYPDPAKVHLYVCDDGGRDSVKKMAEHLGAGYIGMKENTRAKSGNYNHALKQTTSPLIATFDADMIPRRTFLLRTVPYFLVPDQKLGLLQTPQSFYNQDLFQFNLYAEKGIPNEQDFFSREINLLRNATNTAAYTGSNTILLRAALEEIGGFPYGTVTEDFETSLRLQKAGYRTYATGEVLAAGLSTTTVESMILQRIRWARGVIQSIQNTNAIFTRKLSLAARISYLNAWLYWWSFLCRLIFLLAPVLFALFDVQLVECGFWELLCFWLPSHLLSRLAMGYLSTNIRNARWSHIIDTILAPYLAAPVLLESLGIHRRQFQVTEKKKRRENTASFRWLIPHGFLLLLTVAALIRFARGKYGMALVYSSVILYWLGYNLTLLLYAAFFMMGRESRRISDRIAAEEPAGIRFADRTLEAVTEDVSEEGIALRLNAAAPSGEAAPLPGEAAPSPGEAAPSPGEAAPEKGERFTVTVTTGHYRAELRATLVYAGKEKLTATVEAVDETSYRNWLQIIHDRAHSLPRELDPWMTIYDEIRDNVRARRKVRTGSR